MESPDRSLIVVSATSAIAPSKQIPMAGQAAISPPDEADLSTVPKDGSHTTFHLFPKLPAEIQAMIWKESLPQQDECRPFTVAHSGKDSRNIYLVGVTEYPPISIVCKGARDVAISHLPMTLPSIANHPIRIHPRTTICLNFRGGEEDTGINIVFKSFESGKIPPFMVNIHRFRIHLWYFDKLSAFQSRIWSLIISACPNLASITVVKPSPGSLRNCKQNESSFNNFLDLQRDTKLHNTVKPDFWFHDLAKKIKIDGIGDDDEMVITDVMSDMLEQMRHERLAIKHKILGNISHGWN
ncbi:hypothetical protein ACMFMG_007826 [Clarireedia jacksonii]